MTRICCYVPKDIDADTTTYIDILQPLKLQTVLQNTILQLLQRGYSKFMSTLDFGYGMFFANICLRLKSKGHCLSFEAVVPCDFDYLGKEDSLKQQYFMLIENSDDVSMLSLRSQKEPYAAAKKYMLEHSSCIITDDKKLAKQHDKQELFVI